MRILIACEESQTVCKAFRALGHTAFSADIQECSGGHPEWHILGDVLPILDGNTVFETQSGHNYEIEGRWDLIIAHPPCTDLAVSGARHFARKIADGSQQRSVDFFMRFANADCDRICIENPVCIMSSRWRKPDQIIQPYEHGHPHRKATCLWLKGLPLLQPTKIVEVCDIVNGHSRWYNLGGKNRQKNRSKTFQGIADAIASQWSELLCENLTNNLGEKND